MKRLLYPILLLAAVAIPAAADTTSRYLIGTQPGATQRRVMALRNARVMDPVGLVAADLTDAEAVALRQSGTVRYVSRVVPRSISGTIRKLPPIAVNEAPFSANQEVPWGVDKVHARDAWSLGRGAFVNVAILDTGIDRDHPDLGGNVAGTYDTFAQTNTAVDDNGHGTHVAGTIAAADNNIGVVGVAPEAKIWAVKVLDAAGNGSDETVVAGLTQVMKWKQTFGGNWVVSLSLGAIDPSVPEQEAFQKAADAGILAVAAAGNRGMPALDYPAGYSTVIAVAAIGDNDTEPNFSSWGAGLAVVAPGVNILSSYLRGGDVLPAARLDGNNWIEGFQFTGSPRAEVRGTLVDCGFGSPSEIPASVAGGIALMSRGNGIQFADKVRNAVAAGAIGAIIYNNDPSDPPTQPKALWTLIRLDCTDPLNCVPWSDDVSFPYPVTIGLRQADGLALRAQAGKAITIGVWTSDYAYLSGTSMATPHVSGIAALLWSIAPTATASDIRAAITASARDLGDKGWDPIYGYGVADASAAAKLLGGPIAAPAPPPKHRGAAH